MIEFRFPDPRVKNPNDLIGYAESLLIQDEETAQLVAELAAHLERSLMVKDPDLNAIREAVSIAIKYDLEACADLGLPIDEKKIANTAVEAMKKARQGASMSTSEDHCDVCFDPDWSEYEDWKPLCRWDDSSTSKPCPACNADGSKPCPT